MADAAKPSPPELKNLKPALPDVWDLAKLEASVNSTSQRAVTQWLAYLSLWAYLFFTTLSITHRDLILLTPVKLPLIGVELGLQAFFWSGPPLFWVFHLYLVRKITVLTRDVKFYRAAIERFVPREDAREPLFRRLDAFFLTRFLGHAEQGWLLRWLDGGIATVTIVILPLALMIAFQIKYLAFHDEWATDWHRGWLLADALLLFIPRLWEAWHRYQAVSKFLPVLVRLKDRFTFVWQFVEATLVFGGCVAFSLLVATFPDDRMDRLLTAIGFKLERHPLSSFRILNPSDTDFVNDEKLEKVQWTIDLRGRNLRGAQLSGADLRKARMTGADFQDADMSLSRLDESDISYSNISYSNMAESNMKKAILINSNAVGVDFTASMMEEANFQKSNLLGSNLSMSNIRGADFSGSNLRGAGLIISQLQGAVLAYSQIQGADFSESDLRGVNFDGSDLHGARFEGSDLKGARLRRANLWRLKFDDKTSFNLIDYDNNLKYSKGDEVNEESISIWISSIRPGEYRDSLVRKFSILKEKIPLEQDSKKIAELISRMEKGGVQKKDIGTKYFHELVCLESGESIHGFVDRTTMWDTNYDRSILARRFLEPACKGEKHLKDIERVILHQVIRESEAVARITRDTESPAPQPLTPPEYPQ